MRDGRRHLRREGSVGGAWLRSVPQVEPFVAEADRNASLIGKRDMA
jgi:hypothetical protein